eukprot:1149671-Pelagomonas_calceolata.AAC.5
MTAPPEAPLPLHLSKPAYNHFFDVARGGACPLTGCPFVPCFCTSALRASSDEPFAPERGGEMCSHKSKGGWMDGCICMGTSPQASVELRESKLTTA